MHFRVWLGKFPYLLKLKRSRVGRGYLHGNLYNTLVKADLDMIALSRPAGFSLPRLRAP